MYNSAEYYNDYIPTIEKTSQQSLAVNWSGILETIASTLIVFLLIVTAAICS